MPSEALKYLALDLIHEDSGCAMALVFNRANYKKGEIISTWKVNVLLFCSPDVEISIS